MMYIVCIIHLTYWLGFGREPLNSLILIEMPVIFFISGASLSQSKSNKGFIETLKNRIKRVILPYYIYAAAMIVIIVIITICGTQPNIDITKYGYRDIAKVLLCMEIPQSPYCWHLWFVLPYMILSCTFIFHQRILGKIKPALYLAINILLFILIQALTTNGLTRHVFCYNIFMLAGYCYYKKINKKQIIIILLAALVCLLTTTCIAGVPFTPMQQHKFPADALFLFYTTFALCVLSLLFGYIKLPYKGILALWNKRGYTIYLYQSIVFFAVSLVIPYIKECVEYSIITAAITFVLIFVSSTLLSYITYPLEQYIISKIKFFNRP